jgi:SNF2 family DNA or RNA helicase
MHSQYTISINQRDSSFVITGNLDFMLSNKMFALSLKRLKFNIQDNKLLIPYDDETKIITLQSIQRLLEKYSYEYIFSENTKKRISSYQREMEAFRKFSKNAINIRNNQFKKHPTLVAEFERFLIILEEKMVRSLYDFQKLSAFYMAFSQNSCNFSVPGSGKTSIVYGAYIYLNSLPKDDIRYVDKLLIIGPISSFAPWENEYKECFGKPAISQRLSGSVEITRDVKEEHLYSGNPAELTLIFHGGIESFKKEIIDFLMKNKTMVIIDEAHRIKNPDGVWGRNVIEIAKVARSRIILTGTPVPNGYEDIYNLYQFIYPFKFKDILGFHYGNLLNMTKENLLNSQRVKEFTSNISPYFIRTKKKDLELPPIHEETFFIKMDKQQREIYDFIESNYVRSFRFNTSATIKDFVNRAKLIRLRQAAINPSLLLKPIIDTLANDTLEYSKMQRSDLPEEFQNDSAIIKMIYTYSKSNIPSKFVSIYNLLKYKIDNNKFIIWSIFVQNAKELQNYLASKDIISKLLIGEIEQSERELVIQKFNNPKNSDFQVVIANPFCVSESISLHKGCHNAIYMERDYNCANFIQSKDRIHRVGLPEKQVTNYYYFISEDSIDEVINTKLNIKVRRMEEIIDQEIPLFNVLNDSDETDLIKALLIDYDQRS